MAKKRINVMLDEGIHANIREFAGEHGLSVSGAISVLATMGMTQNQVIKQIPALIGMYEEVKSQAVQEKAALI